MVTLLISLYPWGQLTTSSHPDELSEAKCLITVNGGNFNNLADYHQKSDQQISEREGLSLYFRGSQCRE